MNRLPSDLRSAPIVGNNLNGATLAEHLGDELSLLVFLRHFG